MINTKDILIAILMAGTISVAEANDIVATGDNDDSPIAESYSFQSAYTAFGIIDDWVSFSVTSPRDLTAMIDPSSTIGMNFTAFDLYSVDKILIKKADFTNTYPVLTYNDFGVEGTITSFYLKISGPKDSISNYSGYINLVDPRPTIHDGPLAVVPEPATYIMMLAGMALFGFVAYRRKSRGIGESL